MSAGVLVAYAATIFVLMVAPGPGMLFTVGMRKLDVATGSIYLGLAAKIAAAR
jgi:hypothetical protein